MQTFLPYPSFTQSARVLDDKRLNNQINEGLVILRTLTGWYERIGKKGWPNHPATRMWAGYEAGLAEYIFDLIWEWCKRDIDNRALKSLERHNNVMDTLDSAGIFPQDIDNDPPWLGDDAFHSAHRAALLAKDPEWYGKFGWTETARVEYVWPGRE